MVAERVVLLGVEHLEHRARRIAAEVRAHLVDLVDHQQRVVGAGVAHRPDDRPRHRADVGAPVAADLGLVAHAADAEALELAPQRPGDRAAKRGLADAGRTDEAQDRAAGVRLELSHREELEDPVLDLLDVVVILVEHLARVLEVEVVLGRLVPRQRGDPLEIAAHHPVLRHRGLQALESRELAVGLLAHLLGKLGRVELLAQLGDLRLHLVGLAKLLLDGLELLAQEVLALALVELGLDLRLDLRADRHHLELARQDLRQPAQPLADVDLLEQRLLLLGLEPQRPRDQVREHARDRRRWRP